MILLAVVRWSPRRYLVSTLVLGLSSFGWCLAAMWIDPSGGYYLLPSRGWQSLVGSLLALAPKWPNKRRHAELLAMAGLAMIVGAVLLLDHDSAFTGIMGCGRLLARPRSSPLERAHPPSSAACSG